MTPRRALAVRVATIVVVAACLGVFVRDMKWRELASAVANARLWPVALAMLLNFGCLFGKAVCWRILLAPSYRVPTIRLFRITIATFAASAIAPARAGELLRLWWLKTRDGVPVAASAAAAVAEKLLDAITMVLLVAPIPWLVPDLPPWVGRSIVICSVIAIALLGGLYIAVGRVSATAHDSWLARFIAGMHVVRSPKRLGLALATLIVTWGLDLAMVDLVLYATGIDLPWPAGLLILFTLSLAIIVPSTPASVGALEVGALVGTTLLGVAEAPALAFALIYHAIQIVPLLVVGLALEHELVLSAGRASAPASEAPPRASPSPSPGA